MCIVAEGGNTHDTAPPTEPPVVEVAPPEEALPDEIPFGKAPPPPPWPDNLPAPIPADLGLCLPPPLAMEVTKRLAFLEYEYQGLCQHAIDNTVYMMNKELGYKYDQAQMGAQEAIDRERSRNWLWLAVGFGLGAALGGLVTVLAYR